jgi:hypothetical protein
MKRVFGRAIAIGTVMVLVVAGPAASGSATTVTDPVGDTADVAGPGSTPASMDIVTVAITKQAGRFEFSLTLAAPIPDRPVLPPQVKESWWFWPIDTDPDTYPFGFPRGPGLAFPPEFLLAVAWDGVGYGAFVVDRRPTLSAGAHVLTPVAFKVKDAKVSAFVEVATLGDPASFGFSGYTRAWFGPPGTEGFTFTDVAGTPGVFHPWPS